jgi:hypothetical protein
LTLVLAAALSFLLEAAQSYSVLRVSSLLDVACNTGGALIGAVVAVFLRGRVSWLGRTLNHCVAQHRGALWAVVGLWALAQLHPQGWAFMTAPLTQLLGNWIPQALAGKPLLGEQLLHLEIITTTVALTGLLCLIRLGIHRRVSMPARLVLLIAALLTATTWQASAYLIQYGPGQWHLLTSDGVMTASVPVLLVCLALAVLPSPVVWVLCVAALALHTALAQVLPAHPYTTSAALWQQGRFIHLYGLTAVVSALWPVLALTALILQSRYIERRSDTA